MEKTIKIGKKEVRLSNNVGWTLAYRDQFGRDVLPSIMPAIASVVEVIGSVVRETGKTEDFTTLDLAAAVTNDNLIDFVVQASQLEFTDLIRITWAMAKAADDSIPDPRTWVKDFDNFPVDQILPEVGELAFKGLVSTKNLKRLKDVRKRLQPKKSTQTQSSSQDSSED